MGKGYEKHFDNLNTIVNGFEKVSFVPAPKGSPAPTPSDQMKQALGTDVPQVWSRAFAVASNRTGWKFVGAEVFNRFLNTVGVGHFNKVRFLYKIYHLQHRNSKPKLLMIMLKSSVMIMKQ